MSVTIRQPRVQVIHKAYLEGGSTALSSDEVLELCEAWLDLHKMEPLTHAIGEVPYRRDDKDGR